MAGNERGEAPPTKSVVPPPCPTPKPPPPLLSKYLPPPPLGHRQQEAPGRLLPLLRPPPPQILGTPPQLAGKARAGRKERALLKPLEPSMAGAAPTAVASSSTVASPPAGPSTSSANVPPPAPRTYVWAVAGSPLPAASSSRPPTSSATITSGRGPFPTLTRRHGVHCLLVPASPHVETYVQALAKVVGPTAIVAASKMYGKDIFFLASEAAAQEAVEKGLAVGGGVFVPLEPLEDLGVRLVLTSVPPFLPNAALLPALSTLGKLVSVISPLPLGCKDPTLRHILSFRRQVQLLPPAAARDEEALEGSFLVPYQGARDWVFYSTGEARCYLCRSAGHVRRDCPLARGGGAPETPRPGRTSAPSLPTPLTARHLKPTLLLLDPSLLPSGPKRYLPYNARASKGVPPLLVPIQQSPWRRVWQGYYRV
ncbi:unnamed protein product [Caretta caretta]